MGWPPPRTRSGSSSTAGAGGVTDPAIPEAELARLKSHLGRGRSGVRTAADDAELAATRHRTQLAKVGLGERGTPWWEQTDDERRERWESALAELDALD